MQLHCWAHILAAAAAVAHTWEPPFSYRLNYVTWEPPYLHCSAGHTQRGPELSCCSGCHWHNRILPAGSILLCPAGVLHAVCAWHASTADVITPAEPRCRGGIAAPRCHHTTVHPLLLTGSTTWCAAGGCCAQRRWPVHQCCKHTLGPVLLVTTHRVGLSWETLVLPVPHLSK
jgi:hypothetical protein